MKTEAQKRYKEYLESKHWKKTRKGIMKKHGGRCEVCNNRAVQVHHTTYKHKGAEKDYELSAVCSRCHELLHRPGVYDGVYTDPARIK